MRRREGMNEEDKRGLRDKGGQKKEGGKTGLKGRVCFDKRSSSL